LNQLPTVLVLRESDPRPELAIVKGDGVARVLVWPGVGAELRSMQSIILRPRSRTLALKHPMEAVYYVVAGSGTAADPDGIDRFDLIEGSMIHIEPETRYEFQAGDDGIEILGGPCPADRALYNGVAGQ